MSADVIQAQYEQLEALARRFGKQADLQVALQKRLQMRVERLRSAGWTGRGSDAFYREMDGQVFPAMQRLIVALREAQKVTLQIADIVYRAEEQAASLFRQATLPKGGEPDAETGLGIAADIISTPIPTPTPTSDNSLGASHISVEQVVNQLDEILKPIGWISDSKKASRIFKETLKQIGRVMNAVTGERGYVKLMSEFGDVLSGTEKTVSTASNLFILHDFGRYFAGELTNREIADSAIRTLIPVPIINQKIATWLIANMPDPNGRWRGLVRSVE